MEVLIIYTAGADPGFQVRGGGALKKIVPSGGRREHFWDVLCEKSRFYVKKIIFFPITEGGAKIVGVFRVKNHDFTPKNHIFSNFRGGGVLAGFPPPGSAPVQGSLDEKRPVLLCCGLFWVKTMNVRRSNSDNLYKSISLYKYHTSVIVLPTSSIYLCIHHSSFDISY